ncbi:Fungal-specific transcription factor protein [Zalerion maritima]|uniref:Fungal-specific transcription factor protein n=1 Tax=Zalerion maritima TaxID=339359 RepID=A0AAD5RH80_9PEZI|nr:Fungal-specific transcription factor protein [Zalerion maritima]
MQERINQLEGLVLDLMEQQRTTSSTPVRSLPEAPPAPTPVDDAMSDRNSSWPSGPELEQRTVTAESRASPSPSDYGSIRIRESGVSYVGSSHWAAILDSIADLRDHFDEEEAECPAPASLGFYPGQSVPKKLTAGLPRPRLLYGWPVLDSARTVASMLESIPPRQVVDRLVARYFNDLHMATGVIHQSKFLREYNEFWKSPRSTPIVWIGLLFGIISLSTQVQHFFLAAASDNPTPSSSHAPNNPAMVDMFRENIVTCLNLGHYTNGGSFVLEAMILYFMVEVFPRREVNIGVWVLVGNIVQVATHMGYHRDAAHFSNITPFSGEMRRRIWAMIVQIDFGISTQMGLPRLIRESQTNTGEPRNLLDSDFDESTVELPPSRPETEATPILYAISKVRIFSVGVKIADASTDPGPHSHDNVLELDKRIDEVRAALPPCMRWEGLSASLAVPPLALIQKIWLEMCVQRLKIVLHKKILVPTSGQVHQQWSQYGYSRSVCLEAAIKILEFHQLVDEETRDVDGRLYQARCRASTALTHEFLLATSILCFYLGSQGSRVAEQSTQLQALEMNPPSIGKIKEVLRASQLIWLRLSAGSKEARKAAAAVQYVLNSQSSTDPEDSSLSFDDMTISVPQDPAGGGSPCFSGSEFVDLASGYNLASGGFESTVCDAPFP